MWIKRVEWSPDRTSAKVSGLGFALDLWYDEEAVHAIGEVPSFAKLLVDPWAASSRRPSSSNSPERSRSGAGAG
jgi:hypothetical protein